jgi:peroxiredoxin Q/BCP
MSEDPMVGQKAPTFCLIDSGEKELCLESLLGKWLVLYFYPRDNTSACTLEARNFSGELEDFTALGAEILGVSPDTAASHRKFAESKELRVRLLSDEHHEILEKYGAWKKKRMYGREFMGVERSTFLIDPEGTIRAVWRKVKVAGHVEEVKKTLQSLK